MSNLDDLAKIQQAEKELAELESVYTELQADAALTAASMAPPPVGTVADVVSIGKSLWKGDWGGALFDIVGTIPIVGDGIKGMAKGTKIANKMKDVGAALKAARVKLAAKKQALKKTPTNPKSNIQKSMADCGTQKCDKKIGGGIIGEATNADDIPDHTYRGDSRSPDEIFKKGFEPRAKGSDTSLEDYANNNTPSDYVGTSKDPDVAQDFADSEGYVYIVKPDKGIDVNKELGNRSPFPNEQEVVIPGGVKPEKIKGATPVNEDGSLGNSTTLNPNYYNKPNE